MEPLGQSESSSLDYWKKQAEYYEQKANGIQQELDEYTENSSQLEKELETSIAQTEKHNRDLQNQNQRLKNDIDNLRAKLDRSVHESNALENELLALKKDKDKQAAYVRELEQKNDDLERAHRVVSESVSYIETLLNQEYERNAVLENEVDEVEVLREKLQRATDEARDLKQELKVVDIIPIKKDNESSTNENSLTNGHVTSQAKSQTENDTQTVASPLKREINGNAMTPSSRVTAINIVGDLLRKVGLERFLCRECGKVKCSCDQSQDKVSDGNDAERINNDTNQHRTLNVDIDDNIEYRRPRLVLRQNSDSDNASQKSSPLTSQRSSDQPFVRAAVNGDGKLRRSFAVRSREGLENLLSFASRKGYDQNKTRQPLRK